VGDRDAIRPRGILRGRRFPNKRKPEGERDEAPPRPAWQIG